MPATGDELGGGDADAERDDDGPGQLHREPQPLDIFADEWHDEVSHRAKVANR